ncbi:hypothetical protein VR41_14800, partial [Streptomyces sp. NRRL B-1568]
MDFTFTEEQQAAAEAARAVLSGVAPDAVPSPALVPGAVAEDFDRELWRRLADADLLSLLVPPVYGGAGPRPPPPSPVFSGGGEGPGSRPRPPA